MSSAPSLLQGGARCFGASVTTIVRILFGLETGAYHYCIALSAARRELCDRALEAIKYMSLPIRHFYLKALIVIISTLSTLSHIGILLRQAHRAS